jgi:hypothetical protein
LITFGSGETVTVPGLVNFGSEGEQFLPTRIVLDPSGSVVVPGFLDETGSLRELTGARYPVESVHWRDPGPEDSIVGRRWLIRVAAVRRIDGAHFEVACRSTHEQLLDAAFRKAQG